MYERTPTVTHTPHTPCSPTHTHRPTYTLFTHLHKEACTESFTDVDVVILTGEGCAGPLESVSVHDARQLVPHIVGRLERTITEEVVVAPLGVFVVWVWQ